MLIAISYWLISENKDKALSKTKLILQVFQFVTVTYALSQDDEDFKWLLELRVVVYVVHSFMVMMSVFQYLIIVVVMVAAELLSMMNRENGEIVIQNVL
jgi:hypothetical protein